MQYLRPANILTSIFFLLLTGCQCQFLNGAESSVLTQDTSGRVAELLSVQEGEAVADIGAGDGEWTFDFADRVGPSGQVFSTEIDPEKLEEIRDQANRSGIHNITPVLAGESSTGLPPDCCSSVLIRLVYHHFTRPEQMLNSLARAVRRNGRIIIIDFRPGDLDPVPGVPENRGGHGVNPELVIEEMTPAGFILKQRIDPWDDDQDRFCLIFDSP